MRFAASYNPVLLKAYRHRFETMVRELPKQIVPMTLLHYNISRAHGAGIRENVLLAKAFGVSRDDTLRVVLAPLINSGMETLTLVDQVAGPVFADWR